jgi:hypothetical protein
MIHRSFNDFMESEYSDANDGLVLVPTVILDDKMKITRSSRVSLEGNPCVSGTWSVKICF